MLCGYASARVCAGRVDTDWTSWVEAAVEAPFWTMRSVKSSIKELSTVPLRRFLLFVRPCITFTYFLCKLTLVCGGVWEDNLWEAVLSSHVGSGHTTHVVRLGGKCLHQPGHVTGPGDFLNAGTVRTNWRRSCMYSDMAWGHHWRVAMKDSARPAIRKSICVHTPISTLPARPLAVSFPVWFLSLQAWKARSYQTLLSAFLRLSIKHLTYVLENPLTLSHKKTQEKTNSQRSPGSLESRDRNRDRADRSGAASGSVRSGMSMDAWPFPQGIRKSRWAWKLLKPRKRAEDIQNDYSST